MPIPGPSGQPPLTDSPHDRGGLWVELTWQTAKDGSPLIKMDFGTSLSFVSMTPFEAEKLVAALKGKLRTFEAAKGT